MYVFESIVVLCGLLIAGCCVVCWVKNDVVLEAVSAVSTGDHSFRTWFAIVGNAVTATVLTVIIIVWSATCIPNIANLVIEYALSMR